LLVLVAVEPEDTREHADKLLHKLLNYRVFSDEQGKMNLSLKDVGGGLLLVSQFTLAADTRNGMRPSFSTAAPPASAPNCSTIFCSRHSAAPEVAAVDSARICRCTWSMMAR
jgi:D-tyrosyl-tRNA(Tyr) deacylase